MLELTVEKKVTYVCVNKRDYIVYNFSKQGEEIINNIFNFYNEKNAVSIEKSTIDELIIISHILNKIPAFKSNVNIVHNDMTIKLLKEFEDSEVCLAIFDTTSDNKLLFSINIGTLKEMLEA